MKFNEIVFVLFVLALLVGAYFFVQKRIITTPEQRFEKFSSPPKVDVREQQIEYYEKNADKINAREERKMKEMQRQMEAIKPQLKKAQDYYDKQYGYISKLPPAQQEKEMRNLLEKQQKQTEKYKKYIKIKDTSEP